MGDTVVMRDKDDIVVRLRAEAKLMPIDQKIKFLILEAADEIERLERQLDAEMPSMKY